MTYADTSALVKLLIDEPESEALEAHVTGRAARLLSSDLTVAELHRSAGRRGVRATAVDQLLSKVVLLALDHGTLVRAGHLPEPPASFLRTGDAIHLVAAADLGATEFLTYDRIQARSAESLGFVIVSPGRPDGWHRSA